MDFRAFINIILNLLFNTLKIAEVSNNFAKFAEDLDYGYLNLWWS